MYNIFMMCSLKDTLNRSTPSRRHGGLTSRRQQTKCMARRSQALVIVPPKMGTCFFNFEPSSNTEPPKLGFEVQICFFLAFLGPVFFPRDTTRSCLNLYATCYILRTAYLLFLLVYDYDCVCYVLTSECLDMSGLKSIELMLSKFPSVVNR